MWEEMSRRMDEEGGQLRIGGGAELRALLDRVAEEFQQGTSIVTDLVAALGQKITSTEECSANASDCVVRPGQVDRWQTGA